MTNPVYISLKEAAQNNNVDERVLTQLISAGLIEAKQESGKIFVAVDKNGNGSNSQTKEDLIAAKFSELQGQPITLSEAANQYYVSRSTMQNWVSKSKYLSPLDPTDYPAKFNEAEIAYLVEIYRNQQGSGSRTRLLDDNGLPYQLRHPDLAKARRRRKQQ